MNVCLTWGVTNRSIWRFRYRDSYSMFNTLANIRQIRNNNCNGRRLTFSRKLPNSGKSWRQGLKRMSSVAKILNSPFSVRPGTPLTASNVECVKYRTNRSWKERTIHKQREIYRNEKKRKCRCIGTRLPIMSPRFRIRFINVNSSSFSFSQLSEFFSSLDRWMVSIEELLDVWREWVP